MSLRGLLLLLVFLPGVARAADQPKAWLPECVESAEVVSVAGHCQTYVQPGQTHKLLGFLVHPVEHKDHSSRGIIRFDNGIGQVEYGVAKSGSAAVMAGTPLQLHRVLTGPGAHGAVKCVEWRAEFQHVLGGSAVPPGTPAAGVLAPPIPATELGERRIFRAITRVMIQPNSGNSSRGRMWIVHEDEIHGGFIYAIELKCTFKPELFPQT